MSSMSSVAGLSKYITTLPKTEKSILLIAIVSFISSLIYFSIQPLENMGSLENLIYGDYLD